MLRTCLECSNKQVEIANMVKDSDLMTIISKKKSQYSYPVYIIRGEYSCQVQFGSREDL